MDKKLAAGCVILDGDKILLLHNKEKDWYELPGGKFEEEEAAEQAAKRELKEELGLDVDLVKKLGTTNFDTDKYSFDYAWFLARIKHGQKPKVTEPNRYDKFEYLSIKELGKHKLSSNMSNLLVEVKNKKIVLEAEKKFATFEDFKKLEIRIGKIVTAEKVEKADRLLKLEVDFGEFSRQIVSGIAEFYKPEDLIGKECPFIVNLEPRIFMGVESQGMLMAAGTEEGIALLHPDKEVSAGSLIK